MKINPKKPTKIRGHSQTTQSRSEIMFPANYRNPDF